MRVPVPSLFAVALSSMTLAACDVKMGSFEKDRTAAVSATKNLHVLYNGDRSDELYDLGAPVLQQNIGRDPFKSSIADTKSQAGKHISSTLVGSSCFPNEVRLVYHSQFEAGPFTESVVWAVPGDAARLVVYRISPGHVPTDKQAQKGCPV
jgi:hypothetical protein